MEERTQFCRKEVLSVDKLVKLMNEHCLVFDNPIRKNSKEWDDFTKSRYIYDILFGYPVPDVLQAPRENGMTWILDGEKRCKCIYDFVSGKFKITGNIERFMIPFKETILNENGQPKLVTVKGMDVHAKELKEIDIRGLGYSDLPETLQERFLEYQVQVRSFYNYTDKELESLIKRFLSYQD